MEPDESRAWDGSGIFRTGGSVKRVSRRPPMLFGIICTTFVLACSESSGIDQIPVVQLVEDSVSVTIGSSVEVHLLPMLPPGYVPTVTWSTSSPTTATVAARGRTYALVTGVGVGEAVVTASGEGASDSVMVTVRQGTQ